MTKHIDLSTLHLRHGAGATGQLDDLCAYQAARAWVHAEAHTDSLIEDGSAAIRTYVIALNDYMPEAERDRLLVPLIKRIAEAKGGMEKERRAVLVDAALRIFTPMALDSAAEALDRAKLTEHAITLHEHAAVLRKEPTAYAANAASAASAASAANAAHAAYAAAHAAYAASAASAAHASAAAAYAANAAHAAHAASASTAAHASAAAATAANAAHAAYAAYAAANAAYAAPVWVEAAAALDRALVVGERVAT